MNRPGNNYSISKICIPGITAYHLYEWLKAHGPQKGVLEVIVHVGANSCLEGSTVEKEHWNYIISEVKRVFPDASIVMSTIIPVGSKDKLYPLIQKSNQNLKYASEDSNVMFVDHTYDFLTSSGAPILENFRKRLHPNAKGTGRMARKLKYPTQNKKDQNQNTEYNQEQGSPRKKAKIHLQNGALNQNNSIRSISGGINKYNSMDSSGQRSKSNTVEAINKISELLLNLLS